MKEIACPECESTTWEAWEHGTFSVIVTVDTGASSAGFDRVSWGEQQEDTEAREEWFCSPNLHVAPPDLQSQIEEEAQNG